MKAGRTPEQLAREFEPTVQTVIDSVAQADRDAGVRHDRLTTAERAGTHAAVEVSNEMSFDFCHVISDMEIVECLPSRESGTSAKGRATSAR